ncbi:kinase domain protein [Penicillium brevicompactum]|uniref:non-specific serine/threonine protein kinase n=1 Tax=Penicillium brevicompactum TaxID=5074 RepID=A0A9W9RLK6_PENBR|nr:kinase domain protein [Penicillium brevicompactum]
MKFTTRLVNLSPLGFLRSGPSKFHSNPASFIRASQWVEEERAPHYNHRHFYPIQLHAILANRYQVVLKLGWGTSSTVWLAKDLYQWRCLPPRYVAIKVNANNYTSKENAQKELRITQSITRTSSTDEGRYFVRTLLDSFELSGPHGNHICMRFQGSVLPPDVLRAVIRMVMMGLHYLHTQCHVIHTGQSCVQGIFL